MFNAILFDLDGTLTDPKVGILNSVKFALHKFDIAVDDESSLLEFIGSPLVKSFMDIFSLSETEAKEAVQYYREYFSEKGKFENDLYIGISELLEKLSANGSLLAVATSKPTPFAEEILNHFDLLKFFKIVAGSDLNDPHPDKKNIIAEAIERSKCDSANTVMVGDRKHDIIGARENSVKSIGVLYGYGTLDELQQENPDFIAKDIKDLQDILLN